MLDVAAGCDSKYIGMGALIGALPQRGLEALYTMGPDGGLNPTARWYDRAENLLVWSEDLTTWGTTGSPIVTATTVEDDDGAAYEYITVSSVSAPDAATYTWTIRVLRDAVVPATRFPLFRVTVNNDYGVFLDTSTGATNAAAGLGGSHTITSDGDYWKLTLTFTTDDANGIRLDVFPARGANADLTTPSTAAVGEITILRQQLTPGTASGDYRKTEARQRVWDWSGNARHAQVGSAGGADTNDPGDAVWRKNLLADGSSEDLENAAWDTTDVTVDDADNLTFDAQNGVLSQDVATVAGVSYTFSFEAQNIDGNTALHIYHNDSATGNSTAQVITGSLVRYSVTVLGKVGDGVVSFGIQDQGAAGHGQIKFTNLQVEVGSLTDYNAADRMVVAARGDFDGVDDYAVSPNLTGFDYSQSASLSIIAVFSADVLVGTMIGLANATDNDRIEIRVGGGGVGTNSQDNLASISSTKEPISVETWYVVGLIQSGGVARLFLNGSDTGRNISVKDPDQTPRIGIGAFVRGTPADFYDGTIPLVAVYSRALSAREVLRFYNTVKQWWNLDSLNTRRNLTLP